MKKTERQRDKETVRHIACDKCALTWRLKRSRTFILSVSLSLFLALAFLPKTHARLDQQAPTPYGLEVWQTEQGLPQNSVQAVLQTRDGYLWLGTNGGLARFDGVKFAVFDKQNTPELLSNQIRGLYEDRAGSLWISTTGALVQYQQGKFKAFTTAEGLSSNNAWTVIEDRAGNLWIATVNGLSCWRDGKFTTYTTLNGLYDNSIETLLEDNAGALWVGTQNGLSRFKDGVFTRAEHVAGLAIKALHQDQQGRLWIGTPNGLYLFANEQWQSFTAANGLANNSITAIAEDARGQLWFGTPGGLHRWREGGKFTVYDAAQGLPDNRVESLRATRDGGLWIGTPGGLARWQDEQLLCIGEREGLSSNLVRTLYEDRESNLWVGTEVGGLNLLKQKKFTTYTTRHGLAANLVKAVFADRTGSLWVGTQAGLNQFKDGGWQTFTTQNGLLSNEVMALCDDRLGNLWVGTAQGLQRFKDGRWQSFTMRDGLPDDFIRSLYEDRAGNLWIGTRRGLTHWQNNQFTSYSMLDGLANDLVGAITESRDGSLWIGTLGGLNHFRDGRFTNYAAPETLAPASQVSDAVIALYEDAAGTLWLGTHGGGLQRFKDGKFTSFTVKDRLPDDVIYHILEDSQGYLWMSCNKGIVRINRQQLDARRADETKPIELSHYGTADGMETRECSGGGHPAGTKTADGKLWFATVKGVTQIDPAHLHRNELPPPVAIEKVVVDDQTFYPGTLIELPPGQTRFEFYYAGLSFAAPQRVAFKYRLEGFDPAWIDAGAQRVASYTNVPAGSYRFRVLACNNDGVWNETGAAFEFRLKPHFYRTYWFYALCVLGLIAAIGAWNRMRVKRVEGEFAAVLAERTRIAREIHDTLAQGFAGISVQLELVARLLTRAPEAAQTHLDQARWLVRDSLAEARRSVWDLRSQSLENNDLPTALASVAKRLVADGNIETHVQVSGTYRELPRNIEDNLLRIAQEAMTNVIKHAQASEIRLALEYAARQVRLDIHDNGRGFDASAPAETRPGHFGLVGMRERITQLGGSLHITSQPQAGTAVRVEVPLSD